MKILNKNQNQKGFTLVETLVAISIFATSITALIYISGRGINDGVYVKNKITSSYLAAEGIEKVRNIRDSSSISIAGDYWSSIFAPGGALSSCYSDDGSRSCYIDSFFQVNECSDSGCPKIGFLEGVFDYNLPESIFRKSIYIFPPNDMSPDEVIVESVVEWTQGVKDFSTKYRYNLSNWIFE